MVDVASRDPEGMDLDTLREVVDMLGRRIESEKRKRRVGVTNSQFVAGMTRARFEVSVLLQRSVSTIVDEEGES